MHLAWVTRYSVLRVMVVMVVLVLMFFFGLHHLLLTKPEAWSTATDPPGGWGVARRGDGSYKLLVLHRCDQGKSDQTQGHSIILYFLHEMESLETNLAAPTTKHRSGTSATW